MSTEQHRHAGHRIEWIGWHNTAGCTQRVLARVSSDVGNTPMATAFALAGCITLERQIDMTWR